MTIERCGQVGKAISCDEVVEIVVMSQGALAKLDQVEALDTIWGWHVPTSTLHLPRSTGRGVGLYHYRVTGVVFM